MSQPGDYIGRGQAYITTNTTDFGVGFYGGLPPAIGVGAFGYQMFFAGPNQTIPPVGVYSNAVGWPLNGSSPGLLVEGNGRGCQGVCGSFQILEFHTNSLGSIDHFWAKFTQFCECGLAPLNGEIRFNSQLAPPPPAPRTIRVPADFPTIQAALTNANWLAIDTVLVAPGSYQESVLFGGKRVHVVSENGSAQTWITAPPGSSAVNLINGETTDAVLAGFTITNSSTGISVLGSPTIISNIITGCGSGISCNGGSPVICSNSIVDCSGGAVGFSFTAAPVLVGNVLQNNGSGIFMWQAGSPEITNNIVEGNAGDGMTLYNYSDANIVQNLIVNNTGNGIAWTVPQGARGPWVFNNTIAGNGGAGIWTSYFDGGTKIINNILAGNPAIQPGQGTMAFNDFYPYDDSLTNIVGTSGNISADPRFCFSRNRDFHLFPDSPGIDAGNDAYVPTSADLGGNPRHRGGAVDLGAYEFQNAHYVDVTSANPVPPYTDWGTAAVNIQDAIDSATAGEPLLVGDGVYAAGSGSVDGVITNRVAVTKPLLVASVNGPATTVIVGNSGIGDGAIRCVYLTNGAELVGFTLTNGATRGTGDLRQQQSGGAVWCESAQSMISGCVLVSDVANASGGAAFQGTLVDSALRGNSSVNGGAAASCILSNCSLSANLATLAGGAAYSATLLNCVLSNNLVLNPPAYWTTSGGAAYGSVLNSCLLISNSASGGGGAEQSTLTNCTLIGNQALWGGAVDASLLTACALTENAAQSGAGAFNSTLNFCTLQGNIGQYGAGAEFCVLNLCVLTGNATYDNEVYGLGGGADSSTLNNCLIYGNVSSTSPAASASTLRNCTAVSNITTQVGGAVDSSTLYNSIVYYNVAPGDTNCSNSSLTNCCTYPLPEAGVGNIAVPPRFIGPETNNFRLNFDSPCINSGDNAYVASPTDLDGNPHIVAGTVDIGAYEFQSPTSLISYAWLQQFGFATDGSADFLDPDHDGMNNWQEWRAGTDPLQAASVLRLLNVSNGGSGTVITWLSASGRTYYIQRSTALRGYGAFSTLVSNIVGQAGWTSFSDDSATNSGAYYYRIGVQ